jgi:pyruvate dehydrogenase E2 component (dihydrolipoamide acetyltransferase)
VATIVEMPRLSDTMREGTIGTWHVAVGGKVTSGEALADIETDKASMTFESFDDGVMLAQLVGEGDTVPLGTPICVLGKAGEDVAALVAELTDKVAAAKAGGAATDDAPDDADDAPDDAPDDADDAPDDAPDDADDAPDDADDARQAASTPAPDDSAPKSAPSAPPAKAGPAPPAEAPKAPTGAGGPVPPPPSDADGVRVRASPLARRLAAERGVDLLSVAGSGPHGRIVASDVEHTPPTWRMRSGGSTAVAREDQTIRVTQMRKTIAKRLVESKQSAPHFYLTATWRADKLAQLRAELNAAQDTVKVSLNDLVMRAVVLALRAHPDVNAGWEDKVIRQFGPVHLGFAVALPTGLITPVVRDAERLDILGLAEAVRDLAGRARDGSLAEADYSGNSFCVSNLGMFGIEHFTAIINPPAACILAVGAVRDAPVVEAGALAVGKLLTCTLSCDHRVVDGAMGAAFMQTLGTIIEAPLKLVL